METKASFRGGIRWGNYNLTWPFVKMEVSESILTFSYFGKIKAFRPGEIVSVSLYSSVTSGIRIRHQKTGYPDHVIFWTWSPKEALLLVKDFASRSPAA